MLAFIDSPVQLMVGLVVLLIVFGPQKLPEIGQQLGRALRELKRTTSEFTNAMNLEDRHEPTYDPPRYDSYGNSYSHSSTVPEEDIEATRITAQPALVAPDKYRGDFAAAALSDTSSDYAAGVGAPSPATSRDISHDAPTNGVRVAEAPEASDLIRPANGTIPRNS